MADVHDVIGLQFFCEYEVWIWRIIQMLKI